MNLSIKKKVALALLIPIALSLAYFIRTHSIQKEENFKKGLKENKYYSIRLLDLTIEDDVKEYKKALKESKERSYRMSADSDGYYAYGISKYHDTISDLISISKIDYTNYAISTGKVGDAFRNLVRFVEDCGFIPKLFTLHEVHRANCLHYISGKRVSVRDDHIGEIQTENGKSIVDLWGNQFEYMLDIDNGKVCFRSHGFDLRTDKDNIVACLYESLKSEDYEKFAKLCKKDRTKCPAYIIWHKVWL